METKLPAAILYLERTKFDFFSFQNNSIFTLEFGKEAVSDMEVLNPELLTSKVKALIQTNKIPPHSFPIILSQNVLFERDFVDGGDLQKDLKVQEFIDNIPFESVSYKTLPIQGGLKTVATNKDLFSIIQAAFEAEHFKVSGIYPSTLLGVGQDGITSENAVIIREKAQNSKGLSLLTVKEVVQEEKQVKEKNKNFVLISVFIVLIIIAGGLFLRAFGIF